MHGHVTGCSVRSVSSPRIIQHVVLIDDLAWSELTVVRPFEFYEGLASLSEFHNFADPSSLCKTTLH